MDAETLIRLVAIDEYHDEMRQHLEAVLSLSFVVRGSDGVYIPNGRDTHIKAANWPRENTGREDVVIANTLSRLPPDWPDAG